MRRLFLVWAAAAIGGNLGCAPEIPEGHFSCNAADDCPSDWYCWSNGLCYATPEVGGGDGSIAGGDASPADVRPGDALPGDVDRRDLGSRDGSVDLGFEGDGAISREDGGPDDDASLEDGAITDAGCVTNFGELCSMPGRCGARISCTGECVGGDAEPLCNCATLSCQSDGTWSNCPDPDTLGMQCSTPSVCGGQIDCSGECSGGSAPPSCPCGAAICDLAGTWSCPGPPNFGERCDTQTSCGGQIDCNGDCVGGRPPDPCECGTPTCGGCVGGSCGPNSQCSGGACLCTVNACTCPASGPSTCQVCLGNGNIGACNVDAYDCGALGPQETVCPFGCNAGDPPVCACSPQTGGSCVTETCSCFCGTFLNFGTTQCDGSCAPGYPSCAELCFDTCGIICPFPPCPI